MTDDLKQRADAAWAMLNNGFNGEVLDDYRAAVEASIAAALAPVVERVARLEKHDARMWPEHVRQPPPASDPRCTCPTIMFSDASRHFKECPMRAVYPTPATQPPPAEAKCAECGGIGFVCDPETDTGINYHRVPDSIHGCKIDGDGTVLAKCVANRRPCPSCTKQEAKLVNNPGLNSVTVTREQAEQMEIAAEPTPRAPERIVRFQCRHGHLWEHEPSDLVGRYEYVLASLLTAANARVEELEAAAAIHAGNAATMGLMLDKARAEGRKAGIHEAAIFAGRWSYDGSHRAAILALLTKPEEKR
jgi:hypothetical protein